MPRAVPACGPFRGDRGRLRRAAAAAAQQAAAGHDHLADSSAADAASAQDPAEIREAKFRYGLEVVLDGLALRLPR
ncbi:hypothetical protein [Streptomyces sp. NPDC001843]|uniref:hypothetical protein n=1 Tax=Streptomyces sp. NPDC001843 TaxID=3364617 RepID=UPI00367A1DDD